MNPFKFHRPQSVGEAIEIHDVSASPCFINGGQSLVPSMGVGQVNHTDVIDIAGIVSLRGISFSELEVVIGASETHADIAENISMNERVPSLVDLALGIGDAQVRHRGTLGGSIAERERSSDWAAALLGLDGIVVTNKREIPATHYFLNGLDSNELVLAARFPIPDKAIYAKHANSASGHAIVGVFVARRRGDVSIAITGAAVRPLKFLAAEGSSSWNEWLFSQRLLNDRFASSEYRAALIDVLYKRAVSQLG